MFDQIFYLVFDVFLHIKTVCAGNPTNEPTARHPTVRDAIMKIRFLTLTPQQFAEGPATSNLLTQAEKFSLLMNISSPSTDVPMPAGFTTSTVPRQRNSTTVLLYTVSFNSHAASAFIDLKSDF